MTKDGNVESNETPASLEKPLLTKVRSKSFSVNPDIQFSSNDTKKVEPEKQSNWFVKSLKAAWNGFTNGISKTVNKISQAYAWFKSTRVGKVFQAVVSNVVFRTVAVVTCSLALAGITTIFGPISVGVAVAGLVSVGIQAAIDTYQVRSARKLEKENNLLITHRTAKTVQDYVLKLDPKLVNILKDDLSYAKRDDNKKSVTERYSADPTTIGTKTKAVLKSILKIGIDSTTSVSTAATGNVAGVIKAGGSAALSLISESAETMTIDGIRKKFKRQIDEERSKQDTPGYNNLRELKQEIQTQDIQTRALRQLITDKSYWNMSDKEKSNKFQETRAEIANQEKKLLSKTGNFLARGFNALGSILKDVGIAHNPFSKYNDSSQLNVEGNIALTKMMEADKNNQLKSPELIKVQSVSDLLNKSSAVDNLKLKKTRSRSQSIGF